ncbi:DUF3068 domain-containing protein [Hoyosella sp. G463]|uniref:DUF3068 domain-containing protein n=1 Tax=Lolliginicoccus lacisalsi TaxID=2742202 RepID=A0A927JDX7_9ACTN|nr:DUF3068 domain-containing protein [Lolliginicoccus lacisalsi]MBD8507479.1 DUF3068 domain-containing protein [Lolliginicoccus lacisalsi]
MAGRSGGAARLSASLLVGLAVFLLVVAALLPLYTAPKLERLPLGHESTRIMEGSGTLLDAALLAKGDEAPWEEDVALRSQTRVTVEDPVSSETATLQAGHALMRADSTPGRGLVSAHIDRVAIDRHDAMPAGDTMASLQVDRESPAVQLPRDGVQYRFPYGAAPEAYPVYDLTARASSEAEFVGDTELDGVTVRHYRQSLGPVDLFRATRDQANRVGMTRSGWGLVDESAADAGEIVFMTRYYTVQRDLWVEPVSGTIVDAREQASQFFGTGPEDQGLPVSEHDLAFTSATVATQLDAARSERDRVQLAIGAGPVSIHASWILVVLGLAALAAGLALGIRSSRTEDVAGAGDDPSGGTDPDDDPAVMLYSGARG